MTMSTAISSSSFRPSEFWMLAVYAKSKQETIPAETIRRLRETFGNV